MTLARRRVYAVRDGLPRLAIGRGALLNPWFFAQPCSGWEQTGGSAVCRSATFVERLNFMIRHFHLLVEHKGERFACLSFRKVANWYCRVLRPGREIQQQLMMIDSVATFDALGGADSGAYWRRNNGQEWPDAELALRVPSGPMEHW